MPRGRFLHPTPSEPANELGLKAHVNHDVATAVQWVAAITSFVSLKNHQKGGSSTLDGESPWEMMRQPRIGREPSVTWPHRAQECHEKLIYFSRIGSHRASQMPSDTRSQRQAQESAATELAKCPATRSRKEASRS